MRLPLACAALVTAFSMSSAALAQDAGSAAAPAAATASAQLKVGEWIRTSDGAPVGRINYVQKGKDGSAEFVGVIYEMRMIHIPASSLTASEKGYTTTLSKADVNKLG
jgi:hypothetical protein